MASVVVPILPQNLPPFPQSSPHIEGSPLSKPTSSSPAESVPEGTETSPTSPTESLPFVPDDRSETASTGSFVSCLTRISSDFDPDSPNTEPTQTGTHLSSEAIGQIADTMRILFPEFLKPLEQSIKQQIRSQNQQSHSTLTQQNKQLKSQVEKLKLSLDQRLEKIQISQSKTCNKFDSLKSQIQEMQKSLQLRTQRENSQLTEKIQLVNDNLSTVLKLTEDISKHSKQNLFQSTLYLQKINSQIEKDQKQIKLIKESHNSLAQKVNTCNSSFTKSIEQNHETIRIVKNSHNALAQKNYTQNKSFNLQIEKNQENFDTIRNSCNLLSQKLDFLSCTLTESTETRHKATIDEIKQLKDSQEIFMFSLNSNMISSFSELQENFEKKLTKNHTNFVGEMGALKNQVQKIPEAFRQLLERDIKQQIIKQAQDIRQNSQVLEKIMQNITEINGTTQKLGSIDFSGQFFKQNLEISTFVQSLESLQQKLRDEVQAQSSKISRELSQIPNLLSISREKWETTVLEKLDSINLQRLTLVNNQTQDSRLLSNKLKNIENKLDNFNNQLFSRDVMHVNRRIDSNSKESYGLEHEPQSDYPQIAHKQNFLSKVSCSQVNYKMIENLFNFLDQTKHEQAKPVSSEETSAHSHQLVSPEQCTQPRTPLQVPIPINQTNIQKLVRENHSKQMNEMLKINQKMETFINHVNVLAQTLHDIQFEQHLQSDSLFFCEDELKLFDHEQKPAPVLPKRLNYYNHKTFCIESQKSLSMHLSEENDTTKKKERRSNARKNAMFIRDQSLLDSVDNQRDETRIIEVLDENREQWVRNQDLNGATGHSMIEEGEKQQKKDIFDNEASSDQEDFNDDESSHTQVITQSYHRSTVQNSSIGQQNSQSVHNSQVIDLGENANENPYEGNSLIGEQPPSQPEQFVNLYEYMVQGSVQLVIIQHNYHPDLEREQESISEGQELNDSFSVEDSSSFENFTYILWEIQDVNPSIDEMVEAQSILQVSVEPYELELQTSEDPE